MTFDPMSVEVTCVTLPKDHCVQVPWQYINICGYSDQFCKIPHTYKYYVHTIYYVQTIYYVHTTYRMSDHIVSYWTQFRRDKNLRLVERTKKKNVPRAKYSLHDKSNNFWFSMTTFWAIWFEKLPKTLKIEKQKNHRFSKNSYIFLHLMLLLVPMPLFLNLQWEYGLQITNKHLFNMSNTIYIFIF